eukprot:CAMPEP_0197848770 /NCGR_PEP_ID=MMETSP1438-20131217/9991_1 /TAXON_ID=1461541 /ORGANISM="Pterosperma sp., Strain CCMP1384" /LENGTH=142 /DNA_ID=CAMNT_0043461177 /DNA_START=82 /DNA_END=510 /DNA_ORIENTATION=+
MSAALRQIARPLARSQQVAGLINREVLSQNAGLPSLAVRQLQTTTVVRGAGVGPIEYAKPATEPIPEEHELIWDDGSLTPEICLKDWCPQVSSNHALGMWCGGLAFFAGLGSLASWMDKASTVPFVPREYPFDNLKEERGGF